MISGYSDHYRILHGDQLDELRTEAIIRSGAVLEKNKKLSAETNKRRKQLEERWKQHEEAEERRRAEVLLARKARLRAATEKYQKSGLPPRVRVPASARQLRVRSSSLPFQLDGTSPRRASTAMDAASAIERALQAIRSEIPSAFRPAPPSGSDDQHRQQPRSAAASATQTRARQLHGGSFSVGSCMGQSGGDGSSDTGGGGSSQSYATANVNGGTHSPASSGSRVHDSSSLSAGGSAGMADLWDVATQPQQHSSSRQGPAARAIFEKELALRHDVQRTARFGTSTDHSSGADNGRGDFDDPLRTSVDSLDEEEVEAQELPPPAGSSGRPPQAIDSDGSSRGGYHVVAAAPATAGLSRGFSTWRAAEEMASERSHNPHLRTVAAETAAEPILPAAGMAAALSSAAAAAARGGRDMGRLSPTKALGTVAAAHPDANSAAGGYDRGGGRGSSGGRGSGVGAGNAHDVAGMDAGGSGDFVQWQAVNQPPWGQHPGSAARRTVAVAGRVAATPVVTMPPQSGVYLTAASAGGPASSVTDAHMPAQETYHRLGSAAVRVGVDAMQMTAQQRGLLSPPMRVAAPTVTGFATTAGHVRGMTSSLASTAGMFSGQFLTVHSLSRTTSTAASDEAASHPEHAPAWTAAVAAEDAVGYGRSQIPTRAGPPPGPARPLATAYGVPEQPFGGSALVEAGRAVEGQPRAAALAQLLGGNSGGGAASATAFDSGSVYSDSVASLSSRGAVKGILKRTVAGGGADDDSSVLSVRSERSQDLASSKQRSLSTPNIRDSFEVTKKRTDSSSKPPIPRKKSVRFVDSDSELDGIGSEGSASTPKGNNDKVPELQSAIAPTPAGTSAGGARPTSASAAAQKPPAPPSARSQRASSATLAAAARRRGMPAASRLPIHRRWSSDTAADGSETAVVPGDSTKDNGSSKNGSVADEATGIYLGKTPTDEEINSLWRTVRSCLKPDASPDEPAAAASASASQPAAPSADLASGVRGPGQASPITKVTADNLAKLSRTNGHHQVMATAAAGSLLLRGRAASDPALAAKAVVAPQQPLTDRQLPPGGGGGNGRTEPAPMYAAAASSSSSSMLFPSAPPSGRGPAAVQSQFQGPTHGKDAVSNGASLIASAGPGHADPARRNGVTTSMAAFLTAEELSARPLVSESQIARTVHEVEFFHRPAGMHPVPARASAHFRRGSAGRAATGGAPMSALSLEEQKLLQSLEVLNERLKISEATSAASAASTPSVKGEMRLAPQTATWSTAAQAASPHRAALGRYPARQQHWADEM